VNIDPLSAAEQATLTAFAGAGGCVAILADNTLVATANASLLSPFGMAADGTGASPVTATVLDPASTPLTSGPFGVVNTFTQNFPGYLSTLGPAASLATNPLGTALAVIPSGVLGTGSGPVVVFSDENTFVDAAASGQFAQNEVLWRNTIQACLGQIPPPGGQSFNSWINPVGGAWSTAANWSLGRVPAPTDTVVIALPGTYTVTLDAPATVDILIVGGGSGEQTLRLQQTQLDVTVGMVVNPGGLLFLANGSLFGTASVAGALRV
jgi:hypothetical protein